MAIDDLQSVTPTAPARYSSEFKNIVENSEYAGQDLAFPRRRNPSVAELGLGSLLARDNFGNIFPYKDNTISLTDTETPTTILILNKATSEIVYQTNKFILQQISKTNHERFQIIETFGDPSVYFYDKRTRIYNIQGILFDGENTKALLDVETGFSESKYYWATAFQAFYDDHLRGTKLKEQNFIAAIYVNNWFIKGYPIQLVISKEAQTMPQIASFQMAWVVESDNLLSKNKAKWLYGNGTMSAEVSQAVNNYLSAVTVYEQAYTAWGTGGMSAENISKLVADRDKAELAVKEALTIVKLKIAKIGTHQMDAVTTIR